MRKYIVVFAIAVIVAVALAVVFSAPAVAGKGDAAAGKTVFAKKCATCHGPSGEGKEAIAKMMKVELKHLGSKDIQSKTDADLHTVITKGSGKMKPVTMTEKEVDDVVAFLRTLGPVK